MQPRENQSALLSYAVPFCSTSGAMYPWVPLGRRQYSCSYQNMPTLYNINSLSRASGIIRLMATAVNKGQGTTCFHINMIHPTPDEETTFSVLITGGININKLPYEINTKNSS